jgi:microcystin-dependent protein
MRHGLILLLLLGFLAAVAEPVKAQQAFLGEIDLVGFNFAPVGWAFCDGQILSIAQNAALFNLIGTTFGGDGVSTFALPDLRGRRVVGVGQGPGLSNYILGQEGGEENVTLLLSQLPVHTHPVMANGHVPPDPDALGPGSNVWAATVPYLYNSGTSPVPMNSGALETVGGNQPHNNISPYLALTYIIALFGIFPSQN